MINALDFLLPNQRDAVLSYTPIAGGIGKQLKEATDKAIQRGDSLYLPGGLWLIKANNGTDPLSGWHINVPKNKSLLVFGDGDATIIRREATSQMQSTSVLAWITANTGINLSFQNLLFDGNEANCPTDEGFTFVGDDITTQFNYPMASKDAEKGFTVTFIKNGVESIQNGDLFTLGGDYPNRFIKFAAAPANGTTVRLYRIFAHEQSANLKFFPGTGIPNNITLENIAMTGCVGDGFQTNVKIQSLQISNWRSYGRTRRPRADIQLSLIPLQVTNVTNFIGDAFEMEPAEVNAEHIINLNNMLVRGPVDLAGDKDKQQFVNVYANNVTHLGQVGIGSPVSNFFRIRGEFVNCRFVDINRIQDCQIKFNGGAFTVLGKATQPTEADGIRIFHDRTDNFVEFNGVAFDVRGEVTSGAYFLKNEATNDVGRETRFINCRTVHKLDYFANANRNGTMLFDGGQIGGKTAAVQISHGGSGDMRPEFITRAIIKNPDHWTSTLIEIKFVSNNNNDQIRIEMYGQFNAEIQQPIFNSTITSNANIAWIGGFTAAVASDPNGRIRGLPGLILRKSEATSGEIVEWHYKQGKTYASMQYDAVTV
jgi:hypothetical protein